MIEWSVEQARRYQLWSTRLIGTTYPAGEEGIRSCFRDLGGIQLDPLPVLGRNHDLVLQSRVDKVHPGQALDLIHRERLGFEYWDKVLCVLPISAYAHLRAYMRHGGEPWTGGRAVRLEQDHPGALEDVLDAVRTHGPLSSRELKELAVAQGDHREWKSTKAANAALEVLWNRGDIAVSHRDKYRRYFDLTERIIPSQHLGSTGTLDDLWPFLLLKRVRTVGLLPSSGDAIVWSLLQQARSDGLPDRLIEAGDLLRIKVEGIKKPFYAPGNAIEELRQAEAIDPPHKTARFIAPLDPLVWARTTLDQLWGFSYVWEVYKPVEKRIYGYYVLPILVGDRFVGRFDGRYDRNEGTLRVLSYYREPEGLLDDHPAVRSGFARFLAYLGGERIAFPSGEIWQPESVNA